MLPLYKGYMLAFSWIQTFFNLKLHVQKPIFIVHV